MYMCAYLCIYIYMYLVCVCVCVHIAVLGSQPRALHMLVKHFAIGLDFHLFLLFILRQELTLSLTVPELLL